MIILSEVSLTEKNKCYVISLICGILKSAASELTYKTDRDSQTRK